MGVCRICLERNTETSVTVAEDVINALERIIPPLNSALKRICVVCETCSDNIMWASHFIETANNTEARVRNEKKISNSDVIDLGTLRSDKPTFNGDVSICRICLKFIQYPRIFLYDNNTNIMPHTIIKRMLKDCYILLRYELTKNPVMCTDCWTILQSMYTFKKTYMEVKLKVSLFCKLHNFPLRNINEDTLEIVREFFNADLGNCLHGMKKQRLNPNKHCFSKSDDLLLLSLYYEVSNIGQELPKQCAKKLIEKWCCLRPGEPPPLIRIVCKKLKCMLTSDKKVSNEVKENLKAEVRSKLHLGIDELKEECDTEFNDDDFTDDVVSGRDSTFNCSAVKLEPSSDIEEEFLDFIEPKIEMDSDGESSRDSPPELDRMDILLEYPAPVSEQPSLLPEPPLSTPLFTINQPAYSWENFLSSTKPNVRVGVDCGASNQAAADSAEFSIETPLSKSSEVNCVEKAATMTETPNVEELPPSKNKKIHCSEPSPSKTKNVDVVKQSPSKTKKIRGVERQPDNSRRADVALKPPSTRKRKTPKKDWPVFQLKPARSNRTSRSRSLGMLNNLLEKSTPPETKYSLITNDMEPTEPPILACADSSNMFGQDSSINSVEDKRDVLNNLMNDHNYFTMKTDASTRPKSSRRPRYKKEKTYLCRVCPFTGTDNTRVAMHMKKEHQIDLQPVDCSKCDYVATNIISYRKHSDEVHIEKIVTYKCSNCDFMTKQKNLFTNHMTEQHQPTVSRRTKLDSSTDLPLAARFPCRRSYQCVECGYLAAGIASIKHHASELHPQQKLDDQKFVCLYKHCDFTLFSREEFDEHIRLVHNDLYYYMNNHPDNPDELANVQEKQTVSNPEALTNVEEKQTASNPNALTNALEKQTVQQHHTVKHYEWEKRRFLMYGKLNPHEKGPHIPVAIGHECLQCDRSNDTPITLLTDKRIIQHHNSIKNALYYCSQCEFFTKSKYLYKQHMINYRKKTDDDKFYICGECPFQTHSVIGLRRHKFNKHKGTTISNV